MAIDIETNGFLMRFFFFFFSGVGKAYEKAMNVVLVLQCLQKQSMFKNVCRFGLMSSM